MEATVRLLDKEPTISVQVHWRGAELTFLRSREEPVEIFLKRLGISCGKHSDRLLTGADKKRAKKDQKKKPPPGGYSPEEAAAAAKQRQEEGQNSGIAVALLRADGERVTVGALIAQALSSASHLEIEGERLPILVNPPSVQKLEVFGRALAGCPLTASIRCEFCEPSAFRLRWMLQVAAGTASGGLEAGLGSVMWVPEDNAGRTLSLVAEADSSIPASSRAKAIVRIGMIEEVPKGWADDRLLAFGARSDKSPLAIRVVCYNILAVPYARTQSATHVMYPYCPPEALDFAYRQPLLGRELRRLDGDLVFLQECTFSTYRKFLVPLFGDKYHIRCTLKASRVSEGCVMMIRQEKFEVLEEKDFLFRNLLRTNQAFRPQLREVVAKWPTFLTGILPQMSTVFQLIVVRHRVSGEVLVLANTHLFYHPLARHIRLLQIMCLLNQVQELREKYRQPGESGELPHVIFAADLNSLPDCGAVELLLKGEVASSHSDWEMSSQFAWRDDEASAEVGEDEDGEAPRTSAPSMEADQGDDVEPLPKESWQNGLGLALRNPLGCMTNTYADSPLPFTNYVQDFNGTLDWILTAGGLKTVRVMPGPSEGDLLPHGGLPSVLHPSDHLSLAVDLELIRR